MKSRWSWIAAAMFASQSGQQAIGQESPMPAEIPSAPATQVRRLPRNPIDAAAADSPVPPSPSMAMTAQPGTAIGMGDGSCPTNDCCAKTAKSFTPFMLGDFTGPIANLFADVKIGEGESPRPVDRFFTKSNYYNNLNKSRWRDPTEPIHNVDLFRNVIGFEKTFADQSFSLGMRMPFNTIRADGKDVFLIPDPNTGRLLPATGEPDFTTTLLGNISAIAKVVFWENRDSGSLLSGGATLSIPTASNNKIDPGMSSIAFVQPYAGYILSGGDLFVQGFSSLTVPIVGAESIVMFNDIGMGFWLKRDGQGFISGIAPTVEFHLATPLRQVDLNSAEFGATDGLRVFNVFDVTMGATFVLRNNATIGMGMCVPLTGPKPFDIEAISQFNYRF